MKNNIIRLVVVSAFLPTLLTTQAFAYVDCRENTNGCSIEQLVSLCQSAPTSNEDKVSACKSAINKINEKIQLMSSSNSDTFVWNISTVSSPDSGTSTMQTYSCLELKNNLQKGKFDSDTNGEVSKLQKFLKEQGYLSAQAPTGYYGQLTAEAVYRYQKEVLGWNWTNVTSGVGKMTRDAISKQKCLKPSTSSYNPLKQRITLIANIVGLPTKKVEFDVYNNCSVKNDYPMNLPVTSNVMLPALDCYQALSGETYAIFKESGHYIIKRAQEDASGLTPLSWNDFKVINP